MADPDAPLSDDQLAERMAVLRSEGYPGEASERVATRLAQGAAGPAMEEALRELVATFDAESLGRLVRDHVVAVPVPNFDYCGKHGIRALVDDLLRRGLGAPGRGPAGWTLRLPDGEVLEAESLCRVALLAVWLRRMRDAA